MKTDENFGGEISEISEEKNLEKAPISKRKLSNTDQNMKNWMIEGREEYSLPCKREIEKKSNKK